MYGGEKSFSSGLPSAFCLLPPASCLLLLESHKKEGPIAPSVAYI